jgi:hypothetical protein
VGSTVPDIHEFTISRDGASEVLTTTPSEICASGDGCENCASFGVNG